jgi:hypothetical protein
MSTDKPVDVKAEVRALLDRLPDDCSFTDVQRGIAVLMWPKRADGSLIPPGQVPISRGAGGPMQSGPPERLSPEEVKKRLREWLKSESEK